MRFIRSFQKQGTLLFVSHDIGAVQNLCKSSIWLQQGEVQKIGASKSVAKAYLQYTMQEIYGEERQLTPTSADLAGDQSLEAESTELAPAVAYETEMSVQDNLTKATGWKTGSAEIVMVRLERLSPGKDGVFEGGEKVRMVIEALAHHDLSSPILGFIVKDRWVRTCLVKILWPFRLRHQHQ
jgi:lipopolysaccharide transport system ATP-binding protein